MDLVSYRTLELCTHTMRPVLSAAKQVTEQREMKEDKWSLLLCVIPSDSLLLSDLYVALDNYVKVAIRLQKKVT
jgi:hypothetical protein